MNIHAATASYEAWLGENLTLIGEDLELKHGRMTKDPFSFFRATYYRWAQQWAAAFADERRAPEVLAVGDLHVENFGTWRDAEGRLVWGVNDFDEVSYLPYTNDLVRLCASAQIAGIRTTHAGEPILEGYRQALEAEGRPLVLAEGNPDLREMATVRLKDPGRFWKKLSGMQPSDRAIPKSVQRYLSRETPEPREDYRIVHRLAGIGSLGRERFVSLAAYRGGWVAREAKALAPSACVWADGPARDSKTRSKKNTAARSLYQRMLDDAVRCRDPFVHVNGPWVMRRLAPDCSRIELADLGARGPEASLLRYMGWETANVHLGSVSAQNLQDDLNSRKGRWLERSSETMVKFISKDWKAWRGGAG